MRFNLDSAATTSLGTLEVFAEEARRVADAIAEDAASRCPRGSGDLAGSITAIPDVDIPGAYRVVMEWYGIFPEFGTVRQPAQPFMRPAADAAGAHNISTK